MPSNTQTPNVFSVSVANSSSSIAKLNKDNTVLIYKDMFSCTVYLPLVYNDNSDFLETGLFFTAFTVHVDAVTSFIVDISDRFLVYFSQGRAEVDVNFLPSKPAADEPRFLTVFNLPPSVSVHNFSGVFVHNQAGAVARCADYSKIELSVNDNKTTAKIPLLYNSVPQIFSETGVFYVLFDINVDIDTRYELTLDDQVKVSFINGNGTLDILNIPDKPVPYLTLKSLPLNASKYQISNVSVYNAAGSVASCSDINSIIVVKDSVYSTFLIPLSSSNGGYFLDSGRFAVSFTINIDIDTHISFERSDNLILPFSQGSAEFDINSFFGFFNASLTNPGDSSRPVIKAGSSFNVNGYRHTVTSDFPLDLPAPAFSCVLYLYTFYFDQQIYYEFSAAAPVYYANRKGYYNGVKRALWKMIFLYSSNQFLFKTYIEDDFPQFGTAVLNSSSDFSQLASSKPPAISLNGSSNPPAETFSLQPGVYAVELSGAGGGAGRSYNSASSGGQGGFIREIFTLNAKTDFTAFTGSGGASAPPASASGTFAVVTTKNYFSYEVQELTTVKVLSYTFIPTDTVLNAVSVSGSDSSMGGGGGGGGGSASFLYSAGGYFLTAGGGGGGSGGSYLTPGGAGGSGGSIGPGSGGGAAGYLSQSSSAGTGNWVSTAGHGAAGGGLGAGSGGSASGVSSNRSGGSAQSVLYSNSSVPGTAGKPSYSSSDFSVSSKIPFLYLTGIGTDIPPALSSYQLLSVRTGFTVSDGSGQGGAVPSVSYSSGPQSWLNTNGAVGQGAAPAALYPISVTGSFTPQNTYTTDLQPGSFESFWSKSKDRPQGTGQGNPPDTRFASTLTLNIYPYSGQSGPSGGNNRNGAKGGGAGAGAAGSITIYKIY